MVMGRPKGTYAANSLRGRLRAILSDGVPRTITDLAEAVGEDRVRVERCMRQAVADKMFVLIHRESEFTLPPVDANGRQRPRRWCEV